MRPMPGPFKEGKVRVLYLVPWSNDVYDLYELSPGRSLLVATDEMNLPVAGTRWHCNGRGVALATMARFWANLPELREVAPQNNVTEDVELPSWVTEEMRLRAVVVRNPLLSPVNWVVASHLVGALWEEYRRSGTIYGRRAALDMVQYQPLPELVVVPTMWDAGHGQEIAVGRLRAQTLLGSTEFVRVSDMCQRAYAVAQRYAQAHGVTILDTIFGTGATADGMSLCSGVFTPDVSRMAPTEALAAGKPAADEDGWLRYWAGGVVRASDDPWPAVPGWIERVVRDNLRTLCTRLTGSCPI
jgi:phosphoribosylaminoimidazole-succinocarboxamide synthase